MDSAKTTARRDEDHLIFWDVVWLILEILQYIKNIITRLSAFRFYISAPDHLFELEFLMLDDRVPAWVSQHA